MKVITQCLALAFSLAAAAADAAIQSSTVEYQVEGTTCEGYFAFDDARKGARPGVLIVHQWKGLTDYERERAKMLAELGYAVFCADIYGKGVRPGDATQAAATAQVYKDDRKLYRQRLAAALDALKRRPETDSSRLAAIGYCFGGMGALEIARSGADVDGVVSFHGALGTPQPDDARQIKGRVLVLHGAADPHVPPAEVNAFKTEMTSAGVNLEFVAYPGAVHSFTMRSAGDDPSKGVAYQREADEKSWAAMRKFFDQIFGAQR